MIAHFNGEGDILNKEKINEISMNSVYLETFRRRKNELLASQINPDESGLMPSGNTSGNSVYLETFRRRKNKQLASELNISEQPVNHAVNDETDTKKTVFDSPVEANPKPTPDSADQSEKKGGRFSGSGRFITHKNTDDFDSYIDFSDSLSNMRLDVSTKSANTSSHKKDTEDSWNSLKQRGTMAQSKSMPNHMVTSATPVSNSKSVSDGKNKKKKTAKVSIILSLLIIMVCGFIVFFQMNHRTVLNNDQDHLVDSDIESTSDYSLDTTFSKSTATGSSISTISTDTGTNGSTNSSTAVKNTTASVAETTTTSAEPEYKPLRPGAENDDVLKMQKRLVELGYMGAESCTGYYGDYTKARLKQFQRNAGLKDNGIASVATLKRLYADDAPRRN